MNLNNSCAADQISSQQLIKHSKTWISSKTAILASTLFKGPILIEGYDIQQIDVYILSLTCSYTIVIICILVLNIYLV